MDQHDLDAIIKHLQADPVVKASFVSSVYFLTSGE